MKNSAYGTLRKGGALAAGLALAWIAGCSADLIGPRARPDNRSALLSLLPHAGRDGRRIGHRVSMNVCSGPGMSSVGAFSGSQVPSSLVASVSRTAQDQLLGTVTVTASASSGGWGFLGSQVLTFDISQTDWVDDWGCSGGGGVGSASWVTFTVEAAAQPIPDTAQVSTSPPEGVTEEEWFNLTTAEKRLLLQLKWLQRTDSLRAARAFAEQSSAQRWNGEGEHNGKQDAFRHALWQCRMTQLFGTSDAKQWGDAHESAWEVPKENLMDLHNNAVGRNVAASIGPSGSCMDGVEAAWSRGELVVLIPSQQPPAPPNS